MTDSTDGTEDHIPNLKRLTRDLRDATRTMSEKEARFLVDAYYIIQEDRKRSGNQIRAMENEPHEVLAWFFANNKMLEHEIKAALARYSQSKPIGEWLNSIYGIGPVISAGLMAHIDIKQAPTAGHIWRFAGIDPSSKWLGKEKAAKLVDGMLDEGRRRSSKVTDDELGRICIAMSSRLERLHRLLTDRKTGAHHRTRDKVVAAVAKRPWNAGLKTLCWHIGQSFMKFSNEEECTYGHLYREKKAEYVAKNKRGDYTATAAELLPKFGRHTEAYGHLSAGKLPPAQIDARARRWTVKIFLSHMQFVWRNMEGLPAPKPYILTRERGHAHEIRPPSWP